MSGNRDHTRLGRFEMRALFVASLIAASAFAQGSATDAGAPPRARSRKGDKSRSRAPAEPPFTGKYFGYEGVTLHTWEFGADGSFVHTAVSKDSPGQKSTERGTFSRSGDSLALTVSTEAGVAAAGASDVSVGLVMSGRSEGASGKKRSVQMSFRSLGERGEDGIVLDGVTLKPKTW
jgi:hypothetical protein